MKGCLTNSTAPKHWIETTIAFIFELKYGKGLPKENRINGKFYVYGSNGIVGKHNSFLTLGETIILGRKGSVGEVHYSPNKCWPIDTTYYIDHFPAKIPVGYWYLLFKSLSLGQHEKSSAIPGISREDIYPLNIPLPPLNEQKRIVEKLDSILPKVKSVRARLDKIPRILKKFRQSVLAAACSGRLTEDWRESLLSPASYQALTSNYVESCEELPMGWVKEEVRDIGRVRTGKTPPTKEKNHYLGNICFFKPTDIDQGYKLQTSQQKITESGLKLAGILPEKSILVICIGATIGKVALSRIIGASNQQINSIIPNNRVLPEFVFFQFKSQMMQDQIMNNASTTTLPILNKTRFENLDFIIPTIDEQHEIVRRVEKLFALADSLEVKYKKAMERVEKIEQAVLAKAFRGELVEPDPNDESAEELLKRILEEKAKLEAGEKGRKKK